MSYWCGKFEFGIMVDLVKQYIDERKMFYKASSEGEALLHWRNRYFIVIF